MLHQVDVVLSVVNKWLIIYISPSSSASRKKDQFTQLVNSGNTDWTGDNKRILAGMLMTACDVSAICKPWPIQRRVAQLVADEFFQQGDIEKEKLNSKPIAMMDREYQDEFPAMQIEFIDSICSSLYQVKSQDDLSFASFWPPLLLSCRLLRSVGQSWARSTKVAWRTDEDGWNWAKNDKSANEMYPKRRFRLRPARAVDFVTINSTTNH